MTKIEIRTPVAQSADEIWPQFNEDLFKALKPAGMPMKIVRFDGCETGDEIILHVGPFRQVWHGKVTDHGKTAQGYFFVDEGVRLPFPLKKWRHLHAINDFPAREIVDCISFSTGYKWLDFLIKPALYAMFAARRKPYQKIFGKP
jgi:ligand-binding SRPBCC domain-containing protein